MTLPMNSCPSASATIAVFASTRTMMDEAMHRFSPRWGTTRQFVQQVKQHGRIAWGIHRLSNVLLGPTTLETTQIRSSCRQVRWPETVLLLSQIFYALPLFTLRVATSKTAFKPFQGWSPAGRVVTRREGSLCPSYYPLRYPMPYASGKQLDVQ